MRPPLVILACALALDAPAVVAPADLPRYRALGASENFSGNVALGPDFILRPKDRDALVLVYQDSWEGSPSLCRLWILDAVTGRDYRKHVYDYVILPGGSRIVYSEPMDLAAARRAGVSRTQVRAAAFPEEFAEGELVARPVVLDLDTGQERRLPVVGGGQLWVSRGQVFGRLRPDYYERGNGRLLASPPFEPSPIMRLDLEAQRWVKPTPAEARAAADAAGRGAGEKILPPEHGRLLARTRNGAFGFVLVREGDYEVQAVRFADKTALAPAVTISPDGRALLVQREGDAKTAVVPVLDRCATGPGVGEAKIRRFDADAAKATLTVVYGKHCAAAVSLQTLAVKCLGCD
jgi:hypothetical protein